MEPMRRPLILASASPRRKTLLEKLGIAIEILPSNVREITRIGESPRSRVLRLALEKTEDVAAQLTERWVIGADTIVAVGGKTLGKPGSPKEAKRMLSTLSGRNHSVFTAYAIANKGEAVFVHDAVETKVKDLSPEEIDWYIRTGEPFGKAGAYAIQGIGCFMIQRMEGSYSNVVGLPVCEVFQSLRAVGAIVLT
jgi:septum formation protein